MRKYVLAAQSPVKELHLFIYANWTRLELKCSVLNGIANRVAVFVGSKRFCMLLMQLRCPECLESLLEHSERTELRRNRQTVCPTPPEMSQITSLELTVIQVKLLEQLVALAVMSPLSDRLIYPHASLFLSLNQNPEVPSTCQRGVTLCNRENMLYERASKPIHGLLSGLHGKRTYIHTALYHSTDYSDTCHIHLFIHIFIHWWQRLPIPKQPMIYMLRYRDTLTQERFGAQYLGQGYFNMQPGDPGIKPPTFQLVVDPF